MDLKVERGMKSQFELGKLVAEAGQRMAEDLETKLVGHPGELGRDREEVIRQFLQSHLPKRFDVTTGFAFDAHGHLSKQLDIIIANSFVAPKFETLGRTKFFPCESVVSVGQIRSSIKSRKELRDALDNLQSAKALDRSAKGEAFDKQYGEHLDNEENHLHQIFTFLFITGDALSGETVRCELMNYLEKNEPHLWPNVIIAPHRFIVTYCCDDGVCPNTMHARGIALKTHEESPGLLMRFYLLLGRAIEVTRVSGMPYWQYLNHANEWNADVLFSTNDPTPLLRDVYW